MNKTNSLVQSLKGSMAKLDEKISKFKLSIVKLQATRQQDDDMKKRQELLEKLKDIEE